MERLGCCLLWVSECCSFPHGGIRNSPWCQQLRDSTPPKWGCSETWPYQDVSLAKEGKYYKKGCWKQWCVSHRLGYLLVGVLALLKDHGNQWGLVPGPGMSPLASGACHPGLELEVAHLTESPLLGSFLMWIYIQESIVMGPAMHRVPAGSVRDLEHRNKKPWKPLYASRALHLCSSTAGEEHCHVLKSSGNNKKLLLSIWEAHLFLFYFFSPPFSFNKKVLLQTRLVLCTSAMTLQSVNLFLWNEVLDLFLIACSSFPSQKTKIPPGPQPCKSESSCISLPLHALKASWLPRFCLCEDGELSSINLLTIS